MWFSLTLRVSKTWEKIEIFVFFFVVFFWNSNKNWQKAIIRKEKSRKFDRNLKIPSIRTLLFKKHTQQFPILIAASRWKQKKTTKNKIFLDFLSGNSFRNSKILFFLQNLEKTKIVDEKSAFRLKRNFWNIPRFQKQFRYQLQYIANIILKSIGENTKDVICSLIFYRRITCCFLLQFAKQGSFMVFCENCNF